MPSPFSRCIKSVMITLFETVPSCQIPWSRIPPSSPLQCSSVAPLFLNKYLLQSSNCFHETTSVIKLNGKEQISSTHSHLYYRLRNIIRLQPQITKVGYIHLEQKGDSWQSSSSSMPFHHPTIRTSLSRRSRWKSGAVMDLPDMGMQRIPLMDIHHNKTLTKVWLFCSIPLPFPAPIQWKFRAATCAFPERMKSTKDASAGLKSDYPTDVWYFNLLSMFFLSCLLFGRRPLAAGWMMQTGMVYKDRFEDIPYFEKYQHTFIVFQYRTLKRIKYALGYSSAATWWLKNIPEMVPAISDIKGYLSVFGDRGCGTRGSIRH